MCGIIGEYTSGSVDIPRFKSMRDAMTHRGPDDDGLYLNDNETVALGFRRLAIIDLTDAGAQPMSNETGDVWLLFNGEIYNFQSLREELKAKGHTFTSDTDSEVIVHSYEEWGVDCLKRFHGMFAFAIWDEQRDRFFMSRDRAGIKPLHYYNGDDRFTFASEIKGIVTDDRIDRQVDSTALKHYLRYRYVPAPYTIWENIRKVPPGSYIVADDEGFEINRYWSPADHLADSLTDESAIIDSLRETLNDAVESHLVSDVPVSVLLSGGIDSSLVSAFASQSLDNLTAISMGFEYGGRDELNYAETISDRFDLDHVKERLSPASVDEVLDELLFYYDEPLADSSILPTFLLMDVASDHTKVALAGDGGDELFAGYRWYDGFMNYKPLEPLQPLLSPFQSLASRFADATDSKWLRKQALRVDKAGSLPPERYHKIMTAPFSDSELDDLLADNFDDGHDTDIVESYFNGSDLDIKDLQYVDFNTFMIDDILTKVDRASMAHSLEVRVPLLDYPVIEQALSIDGDLTYRDREKKYLLKQLSESLLPERIVNRGKQGFGAPLTRFVDEYADVLHESAAATDGIFDQAALTDCIESDPHQQKLFKLILFELWYRKWRPGTDVPEPAEHGSTERTRFRASVE